MAAAALALAAIGFAIFKYSIRLPIGAFFAATSFLLALLAVAFTGHGVAALQEAGVIPITNLGLKAVPLLGIHPTTETLGAQAVVLAVVVLGFLATRRSAAAASASVNASPRNRAGATGERR
jgi:high-affinity iron transporter